MIAQLTQSAAEPIVIDPSLGAWRQLLLGLVLLAGALALVPTALAVLRRLFPGRNIFFARWGFSHAALLALVYLGCIGLVPALVPLPESMAPVVRQLIWASVIFSICAALTALWAQRLDPLGWRCLGWRGAGNVRAIFAGLALYLLCFPAILAVGQVWPVVLVLLGEEPHLQQVAVEIAALEGTSRIVAAAFAVLLIPLLEEWLFRGFLQPLLVQNLGDRGGVATTSFVFAVLHGQDAFLPIFAVSLVFGTVMLRTQRLSAAWALHALHNGLGVAFLFAADGAGAPLG